MSIDPVSTFKRLHRLEVTIQKLQAMDLSPDNFYGSEADEDVQDLVTHRLHLAIEIMIDICTHIASSSNLPGKETASDVILLLGEHDILSKELVGRLQKAPGQRNILVHQYLDIDFPRLYSDLDEELNDLSLFVKEVTQYLTQQGIVKASS